MELMRLGEPGQEIPVATEGGKFFDLRSITADIDGGFLADGGIAKARAAVAAGLPELEGAASLRIGAPVAKPGAVLCIGQNYAAHAAESGDVPPTIPILFFKHPNTVIGPYDEVIIPPGAEKVDWEVELAVIIGKRASYLSSPDEALDYVAGYTVSNDVSERAYQVEHSGGQWSKGKCCETFNPLGPTLVPAEEVGNPQELRLRSAVNGEARQDSNTSDMVFSVADIIWHLSQYLVLDPGDVINTGTPEGVALSGKFPYLRQGDRMEMTIEKLGKQEQKLVSSSR
ncbi:MAG TPA: fumarylacetoacetate hydrolase family protein [Micrococcaceae bacterium]|nr:fumarylacetoacetate hydrolase family protein [Micrococcaceae bacterium]